MDILQSNQVPANINKKYRNRKTGIQGDDIEKRPQKS
jgi:hypothetical protein